MYKINLQPKAKIEGPEGIQIPWWIVILVVVVTAIGVGVKNWSMNNEILDLMQKKNEAEQRRTSYMEIISELESVKSDENFKKGKLDFVKKISSAQKLWLSFFDDLKESMPQDIWINKMDVSRDGDWNMEGETFSYGAVGNFMVRILYIPHIRTVALVGTQSNRNNDRQKGGALVDKKSFKLRGNMRLVRESIDIEDELEPDKAKSEVEQERGATKESGEGI